MRTIYILQCADETFYTGITTDIERRVEEHNTSPLGAKYTKSRRPVNLVRIQQVPDRSIATKLERLLKKKTKKKKMSLIQNNEQISLLS